MTAGENIFSVTESEFSERVLAASHETPVLVDFWADWCNPCRMLMPVLAKLVQEFEGKLLLAKVNTEEERNLASLYGVRSLPTVKLFKDGQPVDEFLGALPEPDVRAFIDRHIERESDAMVAQAVIALDKGDLQSALRLVEEARQADSANPRIHMAFARVQTALGDFDAAESALDGLPADEQQKPDAVRLRSFLRFERIAATARPASELEKIQSDPAADCGALHELAALKVRQGAYEEALELLLKLLRKDRTWGDEAARKGMLAIFEIVGGGDLVARYRSRMFNALH